MNISIYLCIFLIRLIEYNFKLKSSYLVRDHIKYQFSFSRKLELGN